MQKIILSKYNERYTSIEIINMNKMNVNDTYLEMLYKRRLIKKPYFNKNFNSPIVYIIAKNEVVERIVDRAKENAKFEIKKEQLPNVTTLSNN